jgi:hypothetical protein
MSLLQDVLGALKPAADAFITEAEGQVPTLTAEGVTLLETVVAPKLDIPSFVVSLLKGQATNLETPLDQFAVAELELLKKRVDALL